MTSAPTSQAAERRAQGTRARVPGQRAVLLEHLRTIGFSLRLPMLIAAVFAIVATIFLAIQIAGGDMEGNLHTKPSAMPGGIGALLAIAIWAREERFGPGFLWTLPVDRSRHALPLARAARGEANRRGAFAKLRAVGHSAGRRAAFARSARAN